MPGAVDSTSLERLLDLQAEDTAIKRLRDRRESLPEAQRLQEVSDLLAELTADLEIAQKQHDEIARENGRLEGEVELLEAKIAREEGRLFSGGVSNPKELGALQAEVEMLKRKKSALEDDLLEVMDQREKAAATLASIGGERTAALRESDDLGGTVRRLIEEIDADLATRTAKREQIAAEIAPDLLQLYDKVRSTKGGVGAAPLRGGTCEGCHTQLPAREVERMRAEGGLQRCDNCRRILVIV